MVKRKKIKYDFWSIQYRPTKKSNWITPRTLYYGHTRNKFKTKNKARIWFWKNTTYALANRSNIYSVRFKGFKRSK